MLSRKNRLPAAEFKRRFPKSAASVYFLVRSRPNTLDFNRFGIIISNKVDKRSSRRHYLKRRFGEYLRKLPTRSEDFLIIVSPTANSADFQKIQSELDRIILNPKL